MGNDIIQLPFLIADWQLYGGRVERAQLGGSQSSGLNRGCVHGSGEKVMESRHVWDVG